MKASVLAYVFFMALQMGSAGLQAELPHRELTEHVPEIVTKYRLVDLGATKIDASKLSSLPTKISLAPSINSQGLVTANRVGGGMVMQPSRWEHALKINGITINIYAINGQGDLLVALNRGHESQEWMLWPFNENGYGAIRKHIQTIDPFTTDIVLTDFNDSGVITGYRKNKGKAQPFTWTECKGFCPLGEEKGLKLFGATKKINRKGCVAGITEEVADRSPYLWDEQIGLEVMRNYRHALTPKGWVEFSDMVLTDDNTIYGNFWVKHASEESVPDSAYQYYAYSWEPKSGKISMLDLQGMRLAAVNSRHVLVGSRDDKAMIREPGRAPVELAALMDPELMDGWRLMEATSINDQDQIVGYGWKKGRMHNYLADPIN